METKVINHAQMLKKYKSYSTYEILWLGAAISFYILIFEVEKSSGLATTLAVLSAASLGIFYTFHVRSSKIAEVAIKDLMKTAEKNLEKFRS